MSRARLIAGILGANDQINTSFYATLPVGAILPHAGGAAPSGYLLCGGQAVSRTTYAALFAAIGTAYGVGDNSTTFNVPDLRGRVPGGKDDMAGTAAGRLTTAAGGVNGAALGAAGGGQTHTLTIAQMPSHGHGISDPGHAHSVYDPGHSHGGTVLGSTGQNPGLYYNTENGYGFTGAAGAGTGISIYGAGTGVSVQANGSGGAHPIVQPTLVINYMIRAS